MKYEVINEYKEELAQEVQLNEPSLYEIIMHNDDFTPMEFVVVILERFFYMSRQKAADIMMEIHLKGQATCGVYTKEVAETKITQVIDHARAHDHPLLCSMQTV